MIFSPNSFKKSKLLWKASTQGQTSEADLSPPKSSRIRGSTRVPKIPDSHQLGTLSMHKHGIYKPQQQNAVLRRTRPNNFLRSHKTWEAPAATKTPVFLRKYKTENLYFSQIVCGKKKWNSPAVETKWRIFHLSLKSSGIPQRDSKVSFGSPGRTGKNKFHMQPSSTIQR